ncbi:SCP-domain-containing protein [Ramicandelaber brevisporus]|nr:SCP-domain-containing protein [Ramicandelaber brevisporus]
MKFTAIVATLAVAASSVLAAPATSQAAAGASISAFVSDPAAANVAATLIADTKAAKLSKRAGYGWNSMSMVCAVNNLRAQYGLRPLAYDPRLDGVAQVHSNEMSNARTMTHQGYSATTASPSSRMQSFYGVAYNAFAENIAYGYGDWQTTFAVWRASPGHLANMLGGAFNAMGSAVAGPSSFATQNFAQITDSRYLASLTIPRC